MAFLSRAEKTFISQQNRLLTKMSKRAANDRNVANALEFAKADMKLLGINKLVVNKDMTERQKKVVMNIAERINQSPYSRVKSTEKLYRERRKEMAKTFGISIKQARQLEKMFWGEYNEKSARWEDTATSLAWKKIKDEPLYRGTSLQISTKIGEITQDIGSKKFGLMMRLYTEGEFQDAYKDGFLGFLLDGFWLNYFEQTPVNEITDFVNSKPWS